MSAKMELSSHANALVLEEMEHLLEEVECSPDSSIVLRFQPDHFPYARNLIGATEELFLITSHEGCNQRGTRMPYKAKAYTFFEDVHTVRFAVEEASWKHDFAMKVRFGPADRGAYVLNRHDHLSPFSKRDKSAQSVQPSVTTPVASSAISTSGIMFPQPTGAVDNSTTSSNDSVAFSLQNTQILPPTLQNITLGIPFQNTGLVVSCTECSSTGSVSIVSGYFSSGGNDAEHFLNDGFIELAANDVSAHIDLDINWLASVGQSFNITLGEIPLTPFAIPGVANVGATFVPRILIGASVAADIDFQYGFDVTIPNNSTAVANFGSPSNSTITGFQGTTISPLPFNSKINNITLTLSATLQPQVLLGLTILDENAGAAVFLDMPQLSIAVSEVTNTNDRCEPSNGTADASQVNSLLGNLTHIVPQAELAAGFVIEAASIGQTAYTPFATVFALETGCLAFNKTASTFGPATAAFASATASASAAHTSSAAEAVRPPGEGVLDAASRWQWAVVALAAVFGGLLTL